MKQTTTLIAALALVGCTTIPTAPVSDQTYSFWLHIKDRQQVDRDCRTESASGRLTAHDACAMGRHIILTATADQEPSTTKHTVRVVRYDRAPCYAACVRDGALHVETLAWQGHQTALLGEALAELTGAPVAWNQHEAFGHEWLHVEGYSHP